MRKENVVTQRTSRRISDILRGPMKRALLMAVPPEPIESVDARGERCPMPLLLAKRALRDIPSGSVLEVLSTDAGSGREFESFARLAGHAVPRERLPGGGVRLTITKA